MSENDIRQELVQIKESVAGLQADLKRVVFCLTGDFDKNNGCGLLAEHHERGKDFARVQAYVSTHSARIGSLEDSRKWTVAYAAGMFAMIAAVYFVLSSSINFPKVNLNPSIAHEPAK